MSGIGNLEMSDAGGPAGLSPVGASGTVATSNGTGVSWSNSVSLTSGGFFSVAGAAAAASAGAIRLGNALAINARNGANNGDIPLIQTDASNNVNVGDYTAVNTMTIKGGTTTFLAASNAAAYVSVAGSSIGFALGSTNRATISTTEFALGVSMVDGFFPQAMADAPQTISATDGKNNKIRTTGANTAVRALTINIPPTAGLSKWIKNDCTGSGITVQFSSGTATATIAPGAAGYVVATGGNALWIGT